MKKSATLSMLLLTQLTCAFAGDAAEMVSSSAVPVIYCTDLFHPHDDLDDHFDLACLFALPEISIKAIILDDFMSECDQSKRPGRIPVEQLNALTGRNVPWAIGSRTALKSPEDPAIEGADKSSSGIDLILATLKDAPSPLSIITIGSVRNIAAAFNREPELFRRKVSRLFLFIGDARGAFAEWNVGLDKNAYVRIMNAGLPVYWVPCFDGGLWKNQGNASFWQANHADLLLDASDPLFNYFRYAILQKDAKKDHIKALYEPIPEDERRAVLSEKRNLWCSSVFAYVAGRRFIRRGSECMAVPASQVREGDKPTDVFTFLPVSMRVDPETGKELLEDTSRAHKIQRFHIVDQTTYAQDMTACTRHLCGDLSKLIGKKAAPVPEGGTLVIPTNAVSKLPEASASPYGTLTRVKAEGQPFAEALRGAITSRPPNPWDLQFQFRTTRKIEKGEALWVRFFARTVTAKTESGEGRICAIFEKAGPPYDKSLSLDLTLGRQWQEFFLPFKADATYESGQAGAGIHIGTQEQTVEIADFELYAFGKGFDMTRLPRTKVTYAGQASDAPWRVAADARIETCRKGDITVRVVDASGKPLSGANVAIAMKRHAFGWGSAVTVNNILRQDADGEKYRGIIENYFTRVVFENDLKWQSWDNPDNHAKILKASDWLRERNIEIRGHNLIWPSWRYSPNDLQALKDKPEALRQRINSHIESEVSAMKGRIVDWDVINEPYDNNDVMKVLGDTEMIAWFKLAHQSDAQPKLTLNDYAILSAGGMDTSHQAHFEKTLRFLKDGGAPITGLGMQSHFGGTPTPPEKMLAILDRFAALGLDISITEHDIDTDDEQLQADFTRDFLTTVFSHPSVVAVLTWGFWENSHWKPNGAYYRKDWSVKPAGQVWLDLVTKKWWTNLTAETGPNGAVSTRGFLGDYEITITHGGVTKTVPAKLTVSGTKIDVRF